MGDLRNRTQYLCRNVVFVLFRQVTADIQQLGGPLDVENRLADPSSQNELILYRRDLIVKDAGD